MWEQDGGVLSRSKERRVFLFEQTVIFSELLRKGSSNPGYQFKNSIKVRKSLLLLHFLLVRQSEWAGFSSTDLILTHLPPSSHLPLFFFVLLLFHLSALPQVSYLAMQDSVDGDPCKFVLWSRGSAERFTLQASSAAIKTTWAETIAALLDAQNNFLSGDSEVFKLSH